MKNLDLSNIDCYLLNLDHQPERLKIMSERFSKKNLSFSRVSATTFNKDVTGTKNIAGFMGCSTSHLKLLKTLKAPFMVFEDDVEFTDHWTNSITIPDETDAVNLGSSIWGYVRPNLVHSFPHTVLVSQYTENFKRVYNMCSTHAILYLNDNFVQRVISVIEDSLKNQRPWDLGLASIQKDHTYLIPNHPFVFQDNLPEYTKVTLNV